MLLLHLRLLTDDVQGWHSAYDEVSYYLVVVAAVVVTLRMTTAAVVVAAVVECVV
jgi:hypothetical protein